MVAATIEFKFSYGSGGTTGESAMVQVTLDDGQTWNDVACRAFTTSSETKSDQPFRAHARHDARSRQLTARWRTNLQDGVLGSAMRGEATQHGHIFEHDSLSVKISAR